MSYNVDNIIPLTTYITAAGLSYANFASAVLFVPATDLPTGFTPDTYREYTTPTAVGVDFPATTETYKAATKWLGGIPSTNSIKIYGVLAADADLATTLNKARNKFWWFWSFFTAPVYAVPASVLAIASWCNSNGSYFMNCQTGSAATAIRTAATTTDVATQLTTLGYRLCSTFTHATDPYAGIALCKWFAAVNYNGVNTTITGEYKKLDGTAAENLTDSEYGAMTLATKKAMFYSVVELQGSTDAGRVINSHSHSTYGEWMDDVVNLEAFKNNLTVQLFNTVANAEGKIGQDVVGQALIIGRAKAICEQYISNGYLGPRNYTDPDDGVTKYTPGYTILTKPEDILDISDSERNDRSSAVMKIRVFRKGAIHKVPVDIYVY